MEVWSISNISDGGGWEIRNALCQFLWNMPQHAVIMENVIPNPRVRGVCVGMEQLLVILAINTPFSLVR